VKFEIAHELAAPIDSIELAFLSPDVGAMLAAALAPSVTSIETVAHELSGGAFRRALRFHASAPRNLFVGRAIPKDALTWETCVSYQLGSHISTWEVVSLEQYRRYFRSKGTYHFEAAADGRSRRTVKGEIEILVPLPLMGGLVERLALTEVRKTYDAEAEILRRLATL